MSIIVIGDQESKRTRNFLQAAEQEGIPVSVVHWEDVSPARLKGAMVKIDPPLWNFTDFVAANASIEAYLNKLRLLDVYPCTWLNHPSAIRLALDKYRCKFLLMQRNLQVTPLISATIRSIDELLMLMEQRHTNQVFVKPIYGSGAAGVMAYRCTPDQEKEILYTSCLLVDGTLVNTKKLRQFDTKDEIHSMLDFILSTGAVVEQWVPKDSYEGKNYDLRTVWQFGHRVYTVARMADGPITNLHLNNEAMDVSNLNLPPETMQEIDYLCEQAVDCIPGLTCAGVDIILDQEHKPYIVEVNGQGDLIYQDIYNDNSIYREQIRKMMDLCNDEQ